MSTKTKNENSSPVEEKKYKDTKMMHIESDIRKIQIKTNMYINEYGEQGTFHCGREIVQNAFDECLDIDSPGNEITLTYDEDTDIFTCEDNGRSFNESDYPLEVSFTTLQSGSKFFRTSGTATAGEFGVGSCVVNALSDNFKVIANRDIEKTTHIIEFAEGEKIRDEIKKNNSGRRGTIVSFKSSKKYLGKDARMPIHDMKDWVESLFYLDTDNLKRNGIKCKINVLKDGKLVETFKFKPQPFEKIIEGILPAGLTKKDFSEVCYMNGENSFVESSKFYDDKTDAVKMMDVNRKMHVDVVFTYCTNPDIWNGPSYDTYCNYTRTIDNGTHLDVFEEVFCRYIQKATNDTISDAKKSKIKVTWDDIKTNLFCVISLSTDAYVGFDGNSKKKIESTLLVPYLKETYNMMLDNYFNENPNVLNDIVKFVKLTSKTRLEAQKLKTATQTEKFNGLKAFELKNYIPCNNNKKNQFKEIFIVEGDSAGGSARNGSDPNTQALFLLRGVSKNAVKAGSLSKVMENEEYKALVNVLQCGIGKDFNLDKLFFDRINILTDADTDGFNISGAVLTFFFTYLRPIIEAGKLYKVYSPLYHLKDKENPYVQSRGKLIGIFQKKVAKTYDIKVKGMKEYFPKEIKKKFIEETYSYKDNLQHAAEQCGNINKKFVEIVAYHLIVHGKVRGKDDYDDFKEVLKDQKFIRDLMNDLQKDFPEAWVEDDSITAIVNRQKIKLKLNWRFVQKIEDLIPVLYEYGIKLTIKTKDKEEDMYLSDFLDRAFNKLMPEIIIRYKGLAELNSEDIYKTTMDINNRYSVQYTIEDVKRDIEIFNITHGMGASDVAKRAQMMRDFKIDREDLDN